MYQAIFYNTSTYAITPWSSTHSPMVSTTTNGKTATEFDPSLIPTNNALVACYNEATDTIPSDFSTAFATPAAWLYEAGKFTANPNYNANAVALAQSQQHQINAIKSGYEATLAQGFTSSATGTSEVYGWALQDQLDLQLVQSAITQGIETFPIDYGTKDGQVVSITDQTMLTALTTKANSFAWAQKKQLRSLIGQVQAQTSVPSTPITWTAASY